MTTITGQRMVYGSVGRLTGIAIKPEIFKVAIIQPLIISIER